jgi:hypothetical protein
MGVVTGQDTLLVGLIALLGLVTLRSGRAFPAGLLFGLTAYKYNLFFFIPLLLIFRRHWRALGGWVAAASVLGLVSILLAPPRAYLELLQSIEAYTIGFSPADMISVRRLLFSTAPSIYPFAALLIVAAAVYPMRRLPVEQAFYAGQVAALLSGYHVNWYDGALLIAPLVWLAMPAESLPRTPVVLVGRASAIVLLLGTPLWPFAGSVIVMLMGSIFVMFCLMSSYRGKALSLEPDTVDR